MELTCFLFACFRNRLATTSLPLSSFICFSLRWSITRRRWSLLLENDKTRDQKFCTAMEVRHLVASSLPSSRSRSLAGIRDSWERSRDIRKESSSFRARNAMRCFSFFPFFFLFLCRALRHYRWRRATFQTRLSLKETFVQCYFIIIMSLLSLHY